MIKHFVSTICLCFLLFGQLNCYSAIKIGVQSNGETNAGRPFYIVIRRVDNNTFMSESYQMVSEKIFGYPQDPSILKSQVIFPGDKLETVLENKGDDSIALYFMFTNPGKKWRSIIKAPLPSELEIKLSKNQIFKVIILKK